MKGNTGDNGDRGMQGLKGFKGNQVSTYNHMSIANMCIPQGARGLEGFKGDLGDRGDVGIKGNIGPSVSFTKKKELYMSNNRVLKVLRETLGCLVTKD